MTALVRAIPRILSDDKPDAATMNRLPQAVDDLNIGVNVRRTSTLALAANVEQAIAWQDSGPRTRDDMWVSTAATSLVIPMSGQYHGLVAIRFPGNVAGAGSGYRQMRITRNGTALANTCGHDQQPGSALPAGLTLRARLADAYYAGEVLTVLVSSTTAITGLANDRGGGTHFWLLRQGPIGAAG